MAAGKTDSLGIMLDGRTVRIAHLSRTKGRIVIEDLVEAQLPRPLGEEEQEEAAETGSDSTESLLGLDKSRQSDEVELEEAGDSNSVLFGLFSRLPLRGTRIAFNLTANRARVSEFPNDFGLSGKKLVNRVVEMLSEQGRPDLTAKKVGILRLADGRLLTVDHDDPMPLLTTMQTFERVSGTKLRFNLIDAEEVALIALASSTLPEDEKVTCLLHVRSYATQVLFFQGRTFQRAVEALQVGSASSDAGATITRRLGLAQDDWGLPDPDRILVAGIEQVAFESGVISALTSAFPRAEVGFLRPEGMDASALEEKDVGKIPAYIVPIALGWRALEPSLARKYPTNFVPDEVFEAQKTLRIAWHGVLVVLLTLAATAGLSWQSSQMRAEQKRLTQELGILKSNLEEARTVEAEIGKVQVQLMWYSQRVALMDSLRLDGERWSRLVRDLSDGARVEGGLWFMELNTSKEGTIGVKGRSLYRDRIPRLQRLFESSEVQTVERTEIREVPVYEYTISAMPKIPPPPPELLKRREEAKAAAAAAAKKPAAGKGKAGAKKTASSKGGDDYQGGKKR